MRVLVIGGGVSGLTSARLLLEAGWEVTVAAREWAPQIVSSVAAAVWQPFQVAHSRANEWALRSLHYFYELARNPATGVRIARGRQFHRALAEPVTWAEYLKVYRPLVADELPEGYTCGYEFEAPIIETPKYMQWLLDGVTLRGATLVTREVQSLDQVLPEWPLVVNCSGLGARELIGDETMVPIRGQIVRVAPGLVDTFLFDEEEADQPTYIIPRADGTILGGTALHGDWDTTIRPATTEQIRARARRLVPAVADVEILDVLVGLRPGRPTICLEAERFGPSRVIHNYGHGGAGFTLSWGCAEEVVRLAGNDA
ncbi:MAG: FAD-dependent oxidoreductase [Ardenticatenaceae bacterium]